MLCLGLCVSQLRNPEFRILQSLKGVLANLSSLCPLYLYYSGQEINLSSDPEKLCFQLPRLFALQILLKRQSGRKAVTHAEIACLSPMRHTILPLPGDCEYKRLKKKNAYLHSTRQRMKKLAKPILSLGCFSYFHYLLGGLCVILCSWKLFSLFHKSSVWLAQVDIVREVHLLYREPHWLSHCSSTLSRVSVLHTHLIAVVHTLSPPSRSAEV